MACHPVIGSVLDSVHHQPILDSGSVAVVASNAAADHLHHTCSAFAEASAVVAASGSVATEHVTALEILALSQRGIEAVG